MPKINPNLKEFLLAGIVIVSFIIYYFDVFKDGMMTSGIIAAVILIYTGLVWSESIKDERDEYIRARTDRYLYIITILTLLVDIVIKTFAHESYMSSIVILTVLSISKLIISRFIKTNN